MEKLEDYLDEGMSPEEREAAAEVLRGLAMVRRQQAVQEAAAERARLKRLRWRWWLISLFVLAAPITYVWIKGNQVSADETSDARLVEPKEAPAEQPSTLLPQDTNTIIEEPPPAEPENIPAVPPPSPPDPPREPYDGPIAQADIPPPAYSAPGSFTRGQASDDRIDKALLDQLWYTQYPLNGLTLDENYAAVDQLLGERSFPRAYVGLQSLQRQGNSSDTLRYLLGYTLLEMGQGKQAVEAFKQIESPPAAWQEQLEWYQALGLLFDQQYAEALAMFQRMKEQPSHPYVREAGKAIRLLE